LGLARQLSPWVLLELISRALLKNCDKEIQDDPIWCLLAELDDRSDDQPPGSSFAGNNEFRLPRNWFNTVHINNETFRWSAAQSRLRLWSANGYMLSDIARTGCPADQQSNKELQRYLGKKGKALLAKSAHARAPIECYSFVNGPGISADLERWLAYVMPFIKRRLELALGTEADDILKNVLQCRGKVYLTSTHVDFVTHLENISLAVRRAGLDSDPGWLPEIGRVVLFHFE